MVSLVIYGLIAVALAASAGYAFLVLTSTSRQMTQLQENQVRIETAVSALRASVLALNPSNGYLFVPQGTAGASYTELPVTLGTVGSAPWGTPYLYCPVSQTTTPGLAPTSTSTVKSPSGATYNIGLYSSASTTSGNPYVITSSGAAPPSTSGYIAYIVSSLGPGLNPPDCSAIVVTAATATTFGGVSVPNGTVRGVTANIPYTQRVVASTDRMEIYIGGGATGTGNFSGQDANNLMSSIDNALGIWSSLQPRLAEIYLTGGAAYTMATSTLNGESSYSTAQGQNNSLVIASVPGGATATLNIKQPLVITANTTFQNLSISHTITSGGPVMSVYKPLTLRNVTYSATPIGSGLNVYNTSLTVSDSSVSGVTIGGSNSAIEFLSLASGLAVPTHSNTLIAGNQMRISFDGSSTFSDGTSATAPITVVGGALNVSSGYTVQTNSASQGVVLSNSTLNVGGSLVVTGANPAGVPVSGGIDDLDGSAVTVALGGSLSVAASTTLTNAIYARGSTVGINGALTATVTANGSAIAAQEATVTGIGSITTPNGSVSCVSILNQNATGLAAIPIIKGSTSPTTGPYAGYATFNQSQYGYPILLALSPNFVTTNATDSAVAALITTANANDPSVSVGAVPGTYYVDPTSFEAGVRTIINREYVQGLHINFTGSCS